MFDFVDQRTRQAVNAPKGYDIYPVPGVTPGPFSHGPLVSWAVAAGLPKSELPPGAEKFSLPVGTECRLVRPGKADVRFVIPEVVPKDKPAVLTVRATTQV